MNPAWIGALVALGTLLVAVAGWLSRTMWRGFRKVDRFLEDWNGVAPDSGHEARPGVMERLTTLEHGLTDVQGQVHLNSGHSLKDVVTRTEATVNRLEGTVGDLQQTVQQSLPPTGPQPVAK